MTAATAEAPPTSWRELVGSGRAKLTLGVVLVEFAAAIQTSVVASIMPAVAHDLGGLQFYGLVFSGYSLAGLAATPAAGQLADRHGPGRPFLLMLAVFCLGTLLSGLAPSMPLLAAARIVQGFGGGAIYTIAYGVVAKAYPEAGRARMLALLSAVWVVPGLVGPGFGAVVAATIGWRWAFLALLPVAILAGWLGYPGMRPLPGSGDAGALNLRWPLLLAIGTGLLVSGLAEPGPAGLLVAAAGLAVFVPALLRVLPAGTFRLRRGLPAVIASGLLSNVSFFVGLYFIPLLLTGVAHRSLLEAGLAVAIVNLTWTLGSYWQTRTVGSIGKTFLVGAANAAVTLAMAAIGAVALGVPAIFAYAAWAIAGAGMGVVFNCLYLLAVERAPVAGETMAVAQLQTTNRLGIALGSGLGGASVAVAAALHQPLQVGLLGTFGLATVAAAGSALLAFRLDEREPA